MIDYSKLTFGQCLQKLRKKSDQYSTLNLLSVAINVKVKERGILSDTLVLYDGMCVEMSPRDKKELEKNNEKIEPAPLTINKNEIGEWEKKTDVPQKEVLDILVELLGNPVLKQLGEKAIEEKRVKLHNERLHPKVQICFADNTTCWKCGEKMKSVYGLLDGNPISPNEFNDAMIQISRSKGVILENRTSKTTGNRSLVNCCQNCGTFIGDFYLHDLWYCETEVIGIDDVTGFSWDDTEFD